MSVKELDSLLYLLAEKKRKTEEEESETNMQILIDFFQCLRKEKFEELSEVTCYYESFLLILISISQTVKLYRCMCLLPL